MERRCIIGHYLASILPQLPGSNSFLVASEARRRKKLDQKLSRRRALGGRHSSGGEEPVGIKHGGVWRNSITERAAYGMCAECHNLFSEDSKFCRMCGVKRPDCPFALRPGPPTLKIAGEDANSDDEMASMNQLSMGRSKSGRHFIEDSKFKSQLLAKSECSDNSDG